MSVQIKVFLIGRLYHTNRIFSRIFYAHIFYENYYLKNLRTDFLVVSNEKHACQRRRRRRRRVAPRTTATGGSQIRTHPPPHLFTEQNRVQSGSLGNMMYRSTHQTIPTAGKFGGHVIF